MQLRPLGFCDWTGPFDYYRRPEGGDLRILHWAAGKPFWLRVREWQWWRMRKDGGVAVQQSRF